MADEPEPSAEQKPRKIVDKGVYIDIPVPGGLSLVVSVGLVCLTVFLILVGMGHVDVHLINDQMKS